MDTRVKELADRLWGQGVAGRITECIEARRDAITTRHPAGLDAMDDFPLSEADTMLITYADSLRQEGVAPLESMYRFVDEVSGGAISCVHLLPFFPYSSDAGFSISDYRRVRTDLGDWSGITALAGNYRVMVDLVLNHCSVEHPWFQDFLAGRAPGRDYFVHRRSGCRSEPGVPPACPSAAHSIRDSRWTQARFGRRSAPTRSIWIGPTPTWPWR